jgi:hypothetical protein
LPLDASLGKGVFPPTTPGWELYDLELDPQEKRNVYHDPAYRETIDELKFKLLALKNLYRDTDDAYPKLMKLREDHW